MHPSVRRAVRPHLSLLAVGAAAVFVSAAFSAQAYASGPSTSSVLKSAKSAISEQTGAHVVSIASSSSSGTIEKITADVAVSTGTETIKEGSANLSVEVTPTDAYVKGDSSGLTKIFGLSSAGARRAGRDWVVWKSGTSQYSNLKSDVTVSSILSVLPKSEGTKLSTRSSGGVELYVLEWTSAATSSIPELSNSVTIAAEAPNLPVKEVSAASGGASVKTVFSKWGEIVTVNAPPVASTISSAKVNG